LTRDVRILVVDDEEVIRDVLGTLLEREGYRPIPLYGAYVDSDLSLCYERVLTS